MPKQTDNSNKLKDIISIYLCVNYYTFKRV